MRCWYGSRPNRQGVPDVSTYPGDQYNLGNFSYLPGQRLSRCACPGEELPGPTHDDGTHEIDVFEAMTHEDLGAVSQPGQWGLFNGGYEWLNTKNLIISIRQLPS